MPVVVTGASGFIGPYAVRAFLRASPEVRACIRRSEAAPSLRELGAKVAVALPSDTETLAIVMRGAHTVCHLAGGLIAADAPAYEEANLRTVVWALEAAAEAKVKRFLLLSFPGASSRSASPYLRAKGRAEEAVAGSGLDHVILRCNHVYGPGGAWLAALREQATARPAALVVGTGRQVLAPVFVEDVAAVLAAADDREGVPSGVRGLDGPDRVTADELVDLVAGRRRRKLHVSPAGAARLTRVRRRAVPLPALEILAADCVAGPPSAAAEFGIALTGLREGLSRSPA